MSTGIDQSSGLRIVDNGPRFSEGDVVANRFEVQGFAGEGSMGIVYRALDRQSGEPVALKVLQLSDRINVERFRQEAALLARLKHPGIVRYVDHGTTPTGMLYIAMEWLAGIDLEEHLAEQRTLTVENAVQLVRRVADAVGTVHELGIVHRDIKPNNLFLPDGEIARVKVLDFGIARLSHDVYAQTESGTAVGTPGYMSPEQARGESEIDARTDVFALGCVLYECLTGEPAFRGMNVVAVLTRILFEDAPRIRDFWSGVPEPLDELVARMLSKERADRPANGRELAHTLDGLVQGRYLRIATGFTESVTAETLDLTPGAVHEAVTFGTRRRPRSLLTSQEQRLVSVVLAGHSESFDRLDDEQRLAQTLQRVLDVRNAVDGFEAQVEPLAHGWVACLMRARGMPPEQAVLAAQCALAVRNTLPDSPIVMATGKGIVAERVLIGEAVELAVELLPGVPSGHLCIDPKTAELLSPRFSLQRASERVFLLDERDEFDRPRPILGRQTDCEGRGGELALLDSTYLAAVVEPAGRAVLISGTAGIGKSRLVQEFISRLRNRGEAFRLFFGRADVKRAESAFGLLGQVLHHACAPDLADDEAIDASVRTRLSGVVPEGSIDEIRPFFSVLLGAELVDDEPVQLQAARHNPLLMGDQMQHAWQTWFAAECEQAPVLLVLEDFHWADFASVQVIEALLRHLKQSRFMVLALARPEGEGRFPRLFREPELTHIRLGGISKRASRRLCHSVLGDELDDETLERMVALANGNPFYLEELMRAVASGQQAALPETVLGMVQSRLDALDPDARLVLRAGSVFGRRFWLGGVENLLGAEWHSVSVREWLEVLSGREMIEERPISHFPGEVEYEFRNEAVHAAAYAMLTADDRRLGHRLAGEWLEKSGERDAVVLAEHFERGGKAMRAASWYRRAAEEANEGHDFTSAINCAQRGIACGVRGGMLAALLIVMAEAHCWRGEYVAAEHSAVVALENLEEGAQEWFQAVAVLVLASGLQGDVALLAKWTARLVAVEPRTMASAQYRVIALVRAASRMLFAGRYRRAIELLDLADQQLSVTGSVDLVTRGHMHRTRAYLAFYRDDLDERRAELERAVDCFRDAGDLRNLCVARVSLGYCYAELGDFDRSEQALREALAAAQRLNLTSLAATAKHNLGMVLAKGGNLDEAASFERDALSWFGEQQNERMAGTSRIYLAEIAQAAGDLDSALEEAQTAVAALTRFPPNRAFAEARLATVHLARGEVAEALSHAESGMRVLTSGGQMSAGELLLRLVHVRALDADRASTSARERLAEALARLADRAAQLESDHARWRFLEKISEHAELLQLARRLGLDPSCYSSLVGG